MNIENLKELITYVLDSENTDYFEWCSDEEKDPFNLDNPHIFTNAVKAWQELTGQKVDIDSYR